MLPEPPANALRPAAAITPRLRHPSSAPMADRRSPSRGGGPGAARSHRPDRADLDEAALAERNLLRPLERLLLAVALDQVEPAQGFLRLRERAVHHLAMACLEAYAARVGVRTQPLAVHHLAGRAQLLGEAAVTLDHGIHLGLRGR